MHSTTVSVKENISSRDLNFNGLNGDPNFFFVPQNGYLGIPEASFRSMAQPAARQGTRGS